MRGYYYGARYYDPRLSSFLSVDRFANKFSHQSPYVYASNNPIKFIDVNGDSIKINDFVYMPNQGNTGGLDPFVDDAVQALDYIYNNDADGGLICDLACSSDNNVQILENTKANNHYGDKIYFNPVGSENPTGSGDPYVIWESRTAFTFDDPNSWFGSGKRSPAETLFHELGHANSFFTNPNFSSDSEPFNPYFTPPNLMKYSNREEYNNIWNNENPAAHKLRPGSAVNREQHKRGRFRTVKSSISIP